jgi:hypothetical protein
VVPKPACQTPSKSYELELLNKFDGIAVFTGQDKISMLSFGTKIPIKGFTHRRRFGYVPPRSRRKPNAPSLFFLGSLDWLPNREGIEWFIENFLKEHPGRRLKG